MEGAHIDTQRCRGLGFVSILVSQHKLDVVPLHRFQRPDPANGEGRYVGAAFEQGIQPLTHSLEFSCQRFELSSKGPEFILLLGRRHDQ